MVKDMWKTFRNLAQRYAWLFILGGLVIRVLYFVFILFVQTNPLQWGDIKLNIEDGQAIWENLQLGQGFFYQAKFPFLGGVYVLLIYLAGSGLPVEQAYFWFAISQMLLEYGLILGFYFVVKAWTKDTTYAKLAVIIWLFNPFWLLQQVLSFDRLGYHPTDYIFIILILIAMYFHTRDHGKKWSYVFLGLTVSIKLFTLPLIAILALNFIINPGRKQEGESLIKINWVEIKQLLIYMGLPIFLTFLLPMLIDFQNLHWFLEFRNCSIFGGVLPTWIRILPPIIGLGFFIYLLIKKPNGPRDLWTNFNWGVTIGAIYFLISQIYLRYLIYPLPVGLARQKVKKVVMWSVIGLALTIGFFLYGLLSGTPFGESNLFILPGGTPCVP